MRRVIIYQFFDPQGIVDDFVVHTLTALRPHAEHIFVVSNSELDEVNRARLEAVSDRLWVRDNVGFDVWGFKEGLQLLGPEQLATYDELLLTNCTYFGPITSFDPVFAETDSDDTIDFWGLTEHAEVVPHPFLPEDRLPAHIQSHWLAVRARMSGSQAFRDFWDDLPMTSTYLDAVSYYEGRFTQHFLDAGFRSRVLYPQADYPSQHPIMDNPTLMLADGCPIVKRRSLFRDSLYLERRGVIGRDVVAAMASAGYDTDLVLANLARTAQPRALMTNLGLLEILPDVDLGHDRELPLRVLAVAHVYYPEMTDEILDRFETLPPGWDLVITTPEQARREAIQQVLHRRGVTGEVRLVDNRGRDISAFYVGCRDLIEGDEHDVIVKLHSKRSPQDVGGVGDNFKRHLFDNLLNTPGYTANVLRLFQEHRTLGMVFPPVVHIGYPTLGHAWFANKAPAQAEADRLGFHVPFDDSTPVAPFGSMFMARPAALRPLLRGGYTYDDFPEDEHYVDGALTHVLERLVTYGALDAGLHVREVLTTARAAVDYKFLEYKQQAVGAWLAGYAEEQIDQIASMREQVARAQRERRRREESAKRRGTGTPVTPGRGGAPARRPQPAAPVPPGLVGRLKHSIRDRPVLARTLGSAYRATRRGPRA